MTLPTSGPISLADIQAEFGGTNPISLSEYYAGAGLVPSGTSGTNGAVPSSGQISLWNFYGTSNSPSITLSTYNQTVTGNASARTFSPVTVNVSGGTPSAFNWIFVNYSEIVTWSVISGQGTDTAQPRMTGLSTYDVEVVAEFICQVTIGSTVYNSPSCYLSYTRVLA